MRMWFWIVAVFVLAACATAQTPAPEPPTALSTQPSDTNGGANQQATPVAGQQETPASGTNQTDGGQGATGEATLSPIEREVGVLPPPGTLVTVPATEEVEPGAASVPFASITYEESGGPANTSLRIEIFADGTATRNGDAINVSPAVIADIEQRLDELQFFNIQGQFTVPGAGSDVYEYVVRVELQDGSAKRLQAQDRSSPPELLRLFSALRQIGQ